MDRSCRIFDILCLRLLTDILLVRTFFFPASKSSVSWRFIASRLPRRILLLHGTFTMVLPYLHARLRSYALSSAWPDAPSFDRRRRAWDVLVSIESTYALLGLTNFVAFLWNGRSVIYFTFLSIYPHAIRRYRTIADRILKMRLGSLRKLVRRDVSYEFMNRQMVWHAFTVCRIQLLNNLQFTIFTARNSFSSSSHSLILGLYVAA